MHATRRSLLAGAAALATITALPALAAAPQPVYEVIGFKGEVPFHTMMLVRIEGGTAYPLFKFYDVHSMDTAGPELREKALAYVLESDGNFNVDTLVAFKVNHYGGEVRVCWADQSGFDTFRTAEYGTLKLA